LFHVHATDSYAPLSSFGRLSGMQEIPKSPVSRIQMDANTFSYEGKQFQWTVLMRTYTDMNEKYVAEIM
jgi:hypothetical protein